MVDPVDCKGVLLQRLGTEEEHHFDIAGLEAAQPRLMVLARVRPLLELLVRLVLGLGGEEADDVQARR